MAAPSLEIQLRNAQSAILFMQREHSLVLKGLHEEIASLQQKCSDLQFSLSMQTVTLQEEEKFKQQILELQTHLTEKTKECELLEKQLTEKDKMIEELQEKLKWRELELQNEISSKNTKITKLKQDLVEKASMISQLQNKLQQTKVSSAAQKIQRVSQRAKSPSVTSNVSLDSLNENLQSTQQPLTEISSLHKAESNVSNTQNGQSSKSDSTWQSRLLSKRRQRGDSDYSENHVIQEANGVSFHQYPSKPSLVSTVRKNGPMSLPLSGKSSRNSRVKKMSSHTDVLLPANYKAAVATLPPIKNFNQSIHSQRPLVRQQLRIHGNQNSELNIGTLAIDQVSPQHRRYKMKTESYGSESLM